MLVEVVSSDHYGYDKAFTSVLSTSTYNTIVIGNSVYRHARVEIAVISFTLLALYVAINRPPKDVVWSIFVVNCSDLAIHWLCGTDKTILSKVFVRLITH